MVFSLRCCRLATKTLTAVRPQERAKTGPRLHRASTVAWGWLKCGNCVATSCVHCATLGGADMASLRAMLRWWVPPACRTVGRRVIPLFSKNLPL